MRAFRLRFRQRLFAGIAMFAMLLGALAPAMSQALSGADEGGWLELCSATGTHRVYLDAAEFAAYGAPGARHHTGDAETGLEACPYCLIHAGSLGLPPHEAAPPLFAALDDYFPPLFYRAPQPLFAWTAASPRAPPAFA